uniref:Uncharacterized protein n=1 Tax=Anguilla anguilla TaxID=7936 RepID=A0A0E9R672_ANGAN
MGEFMNKWPCFSSLKTETSLANQVPAVFYRIKKQIDKFGGCNDFPTWTS